MAPSPPLETNVTALPDTSTAPVAVLNERLPWRHTFISLRVRNFRIFAVGHFIAV
ncbi:MAG: MFS transporter, partial [Arthrobacter sp.]